MLPNLRRRIDDAAWEQQAELDNYRSLRDCHDCQGGRLRPESRAVTVAGESIIAISKLSIDDLSAWLEKLPTLFTPDEILIARAILEDLKERITRLLEVGVGYLSLERASPTLSAGEAQRLRLEVQRPLGLEGQLCAGGDVQRRGHLAERLDPDRPGFRWRRGQGRRQAIRRTVRPPALPLRAAHSR